ncbi:PLP-dependent aminotransferase family protein [Phaeobacter sp. HF9A]|uniref:MocR-like pyridoxine biosynthesis transcription factor PdxR n=1 Tax=Phaeobacter sp. HF9A TaxID=2721561 RepID=UPI00143002CF|nr:PLP-dependent aminotransferase family protein [Phaeobacter sp. HF9A]NIZ13453.1 PLP-dependent aminotransferase family protein [Phaeobacter sp. HF9A]
MTDPAPGFVPDRTSDTPMFEQICQSFRTRIRSGELASGARLPATRALAGDMGVARATVVTAYDQLVAEGYIRGQRGSGYVVCALGEVEFSPGGAAAQTPRPAPPQPFAQEAGEPDMRLFPHRAWAKCVARLCRTQPVALLMGGDPAGHPALRQAIAAHVRDWRGLPARPDQVLVTAGATEALDICLRTLVDSSGVVGLENPCYPPMRQFAEAQGRRSRDLGMDAQGAEVPQEPTDAVVLTPSHQFPLGGAMSAGRRQEFLRWAARTQGWIIEDDYDSEFRYAGHPIPAMAGADGQGRTVYLGSFSTVFSNSLRMGYIVAPDALIAPLLAVMHSRGMRASAMPQAALAEFMLRGDFYRHLRRVRRIYAERHRALIDRLRADFADVGHVVDHHAGMQVVLHLTAPLRDVEVIRAARAEGLRAEALSTYCRTPEQAQPSYNGVVLGASLHDLDEQVEVLRWLRRAISSTE